MLIPERLDIYVPADIVQIIQDDIARFEVYKADGITANQNMFLTNLFTSYHASYTEEQSDFLRAIQDKLKPYVENSKNRAEFAEEMLSEIIFPELSNKSRKNKHCLRLKRTKLLKEVFEPLSYEDLNGCSLSKYFRNMLISYSKKPLFQRERIIFQDTYNELVEMCRQHRSMELILTDSDKVHHVIPYCMATGKEEMFNYLLCEEVQKTDGLSKAATIRLNHIRNISRGKRSIEVSDHVKQNLEKMLLIAPQYPINDDEPICVRLTKRGTELYRKIYFGRPNHFKIEIEPNSDSRKYYFDCSISQASLYFRRFEQDTIEIISPNSLKKDITDFYSKAIVPLGLFDGAINKQ